MPSSFTQQGKSYAMLWDQPDTRPGSPGMDLRRVSTGPSMYINGAPNTGSKTTLSMNVSKQDLGRFMQGGVHSPAKNTEVLSHRKMACKRSYVGPDPYGLGSRNDWVKPFAARAMAFRPENTADGMGGARSTIFPRPYCTKSMVNDPYSVSVRNDWVHNSQSLRSILARSSPSARSPIRSQLSSSPSISRLALDKRPWATRASVSASYPLSRGNSRRMEQRLYTPPISRGEIQSFTGNIRQFGAVSRVN